MADEYVVFRKEDVEALAEAIRAKAGLTDKFSFPAEFIVAVNSITGSGGESYTELGNFMYRYGVASDVHISTTTSSAAENLERAFALFENQGVDFVCISGDITDGSEIGEMNRFNSICADHPDLTIHFCNGNHDKTVTDEDWQAYFGRQRNYELIHNNDVFLFLSLDYNYESSSTSYAQGLEWVKERLSRYKGSRIFLFMHFPPSGYSGLVEGQYYGFSANATIDDELVTLLNTTKNVTVFHGHTHYDFNVQEESDAVNVYRFNASDVNLVHVPACAYLRDENWNTYYAGQVWLVNVYEKGFVLTGYDITTGEAIPNTEYLFATDNAVLTANAITLDVADMDLRDGESGAVKVCLAEPQNVTLQVASNSDLVTVSPATLTFTESNYNVPQTVTVTAPEKVEANGSYRVTFSGSGMTDKVTSVNLLWTDTSGKAVLAANSSWWRGTAARSSVTEIHIVDSMAEVPSGYTESWDASDSQNESVTACLSGTTLYLAGNGSGKIQLTYDAQYTFSDIDNADCFTALSAISGMNLLDTSGCTDMVGMFKSCTALKSLDLSGFDTAHVTDTRDMFIYCGALETVNLSGWNTENLKRASNMFWDCESLTALDLSSFVTPKLESMSYMFYGCKAMTSLDVSHFRVENVDDFGHAFENCESLTVLDLSHFVTTAAEEMHSMFKDCASLTSLNVGNFNTAKVTRMEEMFDHCDNLTTLDISSFDTRAIPTNEGLYRFARKSGIRDLTVGEHFVQSYNMYPAGSSGMFYTESTTALTVRGANAVLKTYDFVTDHRTVTFV